MGRQAGSWQPAPFGWLPHTLLPTPLRVICFVLKSSLIVPVYAHLPRSRSAMWGAEPRPGGPIAGRGCNHFLPKQPGQEQRRPHDPCHPTRLATKMGRQLLTRTLGRGQTMGGRGGAACCRSRELIGRGQEQRLQGRRAHVLHGELRGPFRQQGTQKACNTPFLKSKSISRYFPNSPRKF